MFLNKYVSDFYYQLILSNYKLEYLKILDEENFKLIYDLLLKYNFYFINDIIVNYLEIFELPSDYVEDKILDLKLKLGENFVYVIANNLQYLNNILND